MGNNYSSITELDLSNKVLRELPDLSKYTNLKILDCSNNNITHLDHLPLSLTTLYCSNNPLIYNFYPTLENIRKHKKNKLNSNFFIINTYHHVN